MCRIAIRLRRAAVMSLGSTMFMRAKMRLYLTALIIRTTEFCCLHPVRRAADALCGRWICACE